MPPPRTGERFAKFADLRHGCTMSRVKLAFVASGGAARGLAHLGVLRACEEMGLLPEIFVGTSVGAIVGATYGQNIPLDVLLDAITWWHRDLDAPCSRLPGA